MDQIEIKKLTTYIEENLRSSQTKGLQFVDTRNFLTRLCLRQNHVIYGRRGAGKSTLVKEPQKIQGFICTYINVEDFKAITLPNVTIKILIELFANLKKELGDKKFLFIKLNKKTIKEIDDVLQTLESYLYEPDEEIQSVNTTENISENISANVNSKFGGIAAASEHDKRKEVRRTIGLSKSDFLKKELSQYKKLIIKISKSLPQKIILLILDDLYFIEPNQQPELIDHFHILTKDTNLNIKIATIRHRSILYKRDKNQTIGAEPAHDIFEIDMDYTLSNFSEMKEFMRKLLLTAIKESNAKINIDDIFTGDAFSQLCLASGGVPRDFLLLFLTLANNLPANRLVRKTDVTKAAIHNIKSKKDSMKKDTNYETELLERYLNQIIKYVYINKRTNCFLISKEGLETNTQLNLLVHELVDLRFLHVINDNTSKAPSDGRFYEAFIIDLGLYDTALPRNFKQIDPGQRDERSRQDALRASPVVTQQILDSV